MQKYGKVFLRKTILCVFFFMLSFTFLYAQQIPHLIKYTGNLKELSEDKKDTKEEKQEKDADKGKIYALTFRIYNVETGGIALWKEIHPKVSVKNGEFEVVLGSTNSLGLKFDADYWLSIEIENRGEKGPREKITSSGYAYMSEDSYKLGGRYPDEYAFLNHSHLGEDIVTPVSEAVNADMVDGKHADEIGGLKDHGMLEGLVDDDHPQYFNELRADGRYAGSNWDGITKLETAQTHIVDKNNPHSVSLEQLGHVDNNSEEEAPTVAERGEPTGQEIQGWADDIIAWGHSNVVTNLNADKLDGKDAGKFSLLVHLHTLMDISDVTAELRTAFLAAGTAGASGTNRLATLADVPLLSGLWTDAGDYIYPNNAGSNFQITDTGNLFVNSVSGWSTIQLRSDYVTSFGEVGGHIRLLANGNNVDKSMIISIDNRTGLTPDIQGANFFTNSAGGFKFFTGPDDNHAGHKVSIAFNGNVGIGTANPGAKLEIRGDGISSPFLHITELSPAQNFGIRFFDGSGNMRGAVESGSGGDQLFFRAGTTERMRIDASGNVGIGISTPSERLHVAGYVKAQGYKTGDIIFEKEGKSLWRMFEDEDGLYLQNSQTGKVYQFVLQEVDGN